MSKELLNALRNKESFMRVCSITDVKNIVNPILDNKEEKFCYLDNLEAAIDALHELVLGQIKENENSKVAKENKLYIDTVSFDLAYEYKKLKKVLGKIGYFAKHVDHDDIVQKRLQKALARYFIVIETLPKKYIQGIPKKLKYLPLVAIHNIGPKDSFRYLVEVKETYSQWLMDCKYTNSAANEMVEERVYKNREVFIADSPMVKMNSDIEYQNENLYDEIAKLVNRVCTSDAYDPYDPYAEEYAPYTEPKAEVIRDHLKHDRYIYEIVTMIRDKVLEINPDAKNIFECEFDYDFTNKVKHLVPCRPTELLYPDTVTHRYHVKYDEETETIIPLTDEDDCLDEDEDDDL